jgi:putative RecB family exonuclease
MEIEWSWGRMQEVKLQPRSVSQLSSYMEELGGCNYRYFLVRIAQAWDKPAAWLPQGLAVHEAAEAWEMSDRQMPRDQVIEVYKEAYRAHTRRLAKDTPNFDYWSPSWKYVGWGDITRRALIGLEQINRYLDWYEKHPGERIWRTPKGEKAIEIRFDMSLGVVKVIGYIDQIIETGVHQLRLRDIKTGKKPGGVLQLKVYSLAVEKQYGVTISEGDYWMGGTGKPTRETYDLSSMSEEQMVDLFERMDRGVKAEEFEPSPDPDKCRMCPVRTACVFAE